MQEDAIAIERAWDARVARLLTKLPDRGRHALDWLRVPERRWLRLGAAAILIRCIAARASWCELGLDMGRRL